MKRKKVLDTTDDILEDPESDYEEAHALNFDEQDRGGKIYESIAHETEPEEDIEFEKVVRDLPDFEFDLDE